MNLNINNSFIKVNHYSQQRQKLLLTKDKNQEKAIQQDSTSDSTAILDDELGSSSAQKFSPHSEKMSYVAAQFRNRRSDKLESEALDENSLERVLDDNVDTKFTKLVGMLNTIKDINKLTQEARSIFPDESDLILVLRKMLRQYSIRSQLSDKLQKIIKIIEHQANLKRLKSGINIALKAKLFSKALAMTPALMRESYREFLESEMSELEVYQNWISVYGSQNRVTVINFMEDSLLADINAADPSCSNLEFSYLLGRVKQIKLIRSCDNLFIQSILSYQCIKKLEVIENKWLFFIFSFFLKTLKLEYLINEVLGSGFKSLCKNEKLVILQMIYFSLRKLPVDIFKSQDEREGLLLSFNLFLDDFQ